MSIPLAVAFTKHLGGSLLPPAGRSEATDPTSAEVAAMTIDVDDGAVGSQQKDKFQKLLTAYYDGLSRRSIRDHLVDVLTSLNVAV